MLALAAGVPAQADPVLRLIAGDSAGTNRLRNAGFEEAPNAQFTGWQRGPQGWRIAPGEGRQGSQALACEAADTTDWLGASQTLTLNRTNIVPLVVRGWSRAEAVSGSADNDYSLYVDILYADGTPLWGRTGQFRTGTHDWELREFAILPEKPVRSLTLYCLFRGHAGKVWFDDIHLAEQQAPDGAVMFQGVPMELVVSPSPPPSDPVSYATQDGLRLTLDDLRATGLAVAGRERATSAPSGFLAWDVARRTDVHPFVRGACPELGLQLQTTVTPHADHLAFEGRVSSTNNHDRSILLAFALPLDGTGWNWHDDLRGYRQIDPAGGEYQNVVPAGCGTTGSLSAYPLACIEDGRTGLALALDMGRPAQWRLVYHAGPRQFPIGSSRAGASGRPGRN